MFPLPPLLLQTLTNNTFAAAATPLRLNGLIYLCLATKDLSRSKVFSFLDDIKNQFEAITGGQRVGTAWSLVSLLFSLTAADVRTSTIQF